MRTKSGTGELKRQRAKGDILLAVLERIAEGVSDLPLLFIAMVEAGYGASHGHMEYALKSVRADAASAARTAAEERDAKRKYQKLLSALKRDGLVVIGPGVRGNLLRLTEKGRRKLAALWKQKKGKLPAAVYRVERSDAFTIVAFDIPERERRKRNWLREALRNAGFTAVQKSVWMGKVKIPVELLDDIRRLRLADFVEIFQITKRGTLKQIE
ncbi:MAG: CRISPR-associated endonuclease Cas2 [Candidatus Jorgensenbacteria bacterium]|nr:CRISPR-associated endonuclease Cas2 [Candidatus Jorgensenbacteria bacterium]